ncbi:endonuclease/exonuclease/phosphatase family protein [Aliisedimentitalea scapharcae]|uniref:Endonuclease/exonuclease/phosphatase family protein n=1 Tax=Aliisedimentitalea scapharcae TaxID=1524259 RepID=A0ABZ2XPR4_9RHOB
MRLATYNVEWFANLFDQNDQLMEDDRWSGRQDVTRGQQSRALGQVFQRVDADAIMLIEAPNTGRKQNTVRALEHFAGRFDLRTRKSVIGFANDTQQEIALLYDPDVIEVAHDPQGPAVGETGQGSARFDGVFHIDLDVDATQDKVVFSKPPLELAMLTKNGTALRLIGVHLKSKAPHGERTRDAQIRRSIANRRKQLAQAIWLRRRVDEHLARNESVIVLGDLNDGPGLDEYEHLFGRSSVEIVLGEDLTDPHAGKLIARRAGEVPTTARFFNPEAKRFFQALLDYVMISDDLMARRPAWRIWHPFDDVECWNDAEFCDALLTASDHFPVTLDIEI